jgi:hypothetical protein
LNVAGFVVLAGAVWDCGDAARDQHRMKKRMLRCRRIPTFQNQNVITGERLPNGETVA